MRLFLPSARATNALLIVGFCALGYAFYIRDNAMEQSTVRLACAAGLNTWLCTSLRVVTVLFLNSVFGLAALSLAAINLLRPSLVGFGAGLAVASLGLVFQNVGLSALAIGLLVLSFARPAPASG
jgi:hypothetical protein